LHKNLNILKTIHDSILTMNKKYYCSSYFSEQVWEQVGILKTNTTENFMINNFFVVRNMFCISNMDETHLKTLTVFNVDTPAGDLIQDHVWGADRKAAFHSVQKKTTVKLQNPPKNENLNMSALRPNQEDRACPGHFILSIKVHSVYGRLLQEEEQAPINRKVSGSTGPHVAYRCIHRCVNG